MVTAKQQELLDIAKEKGFVTIQDSYNVYDSQSARINALQKLITLGFLKRGNIPNRFEKVKR